MALAALAVLAICAADAARKPNASRNQATDAELIRLTLNEIRRLINTLVLRPIRDRAHRLYWSHRRRSHQARARRCHYKRRLNLELRA